MIGFLILLGFTTIAPRIVADPAIVWCGHRLASAPIGGAAITSEVDFPAWARGKTAEWLQTDEVGA
jgi:hypothetical protein